jgi:hypothetical protein
MKIAPSFIKKGLVPTKKSLTEFVGQLHTTYQNLSQAFNGGVSYGDGTNTENIDGSWASVTTPAGNFTVTHGLNRVPVGVHVTQKSAFCDVFTVSSTKTTITLQASAAGVAIKLFIFLLFLCLIPLKSGAQGIGFHDIALKTVVATGNSGLSGPILEPIAGAVISVCIGSTAPSSGTTCSPTNASLFSCVALSGCSISNPTNADSNGNFSFFVAPATTYVISVSGTGLNTYSYVWNSTLSSSGNNILSGNNTFTGNNTFNQPVSFGAATGTCPSNPTLYNIGSFTSKIAECFAGGVGGGVLAYVTSVTNGDLVEFTDSFGGIGDSGVTPANFVQMIYTTPSTAGTSSIPATTMTTAGSSGNTYRFSQYVDQTSLGTSCTGNTDVNVDLLFTDPNASTQTNVLTIAWVITGNGTLGANSTSSVSSTVPQSLVIRAKASTVVQYSVTYGAGSGCSPSPAFQIYPTLELLH